MVRDVAGDEALVPKWNVGYFLLGAAEIVALSYR